ncbi:ABC transporter substrate-binding protein [Clostridium vincentii]|uniref:Corrinoid ABC transporter substrate-binding protein n=1 Tax=Clostridium vincentii TaxID=52704 RepID=A0A2T0B827_9CLOT|nr:ABC transporter substrate-binding protein [Clostridium vincentii]PRR80005.1 corrinoid ABC transporter substrate-binding protein [Clostridium vincentii]
MKKLSSLFLVFIITSTLFIGCGNTSNTNESENVKSTGKTITDMAGRTMEVPSEINKVYCSGQPAIVMMHNINLDKLLGWCFELKDYEKKYMDPKYQDLPVIGAMQGKNGTVSKEELLSYNPQIILSMGTIGDSAVSDADKLSQDIGVPVVVVDSSLQNLDKSYEFLGSLLDEKEVTDELAQYCKNTMDQLREITSKIPEDKKVRVYYAGGEKGLETAPIGNWHAELLDYAGAKNVVDFKAAGGRSEVSMEQVITWNPDVVVEAIYDNHLDGVFNSKEWEGISAVQNNKVYSAPDEPYNWVDTPPSSNRIIGLKWLVTTLYPEYSEIDMKKEIKEYYKLFYKVDIDDAAAEELLNTKAIQ